jgi:BlaI family transcriptional regulator, penicillinase repressor
MTRQRRAKSERPLTRLELQIMKILWEQGPSNVQAVQKALTPPLAYTTVQTMLNVLHRKRRVKRALRGRAFEYEAVLSRETATGNALRDVIDRMFGGSAEALVMALLNTKQLKKAELAKLRGLIESSKEGAQGGKR